MPEKPKMKLNTGKYTLPEKDSVEFYPAELKVEQEVEQEPPGCLENFVSSPLVRLIIWLGITGYGLFTTITDWLVVNDMIHSYASLVFGPPSVGVQAMFIICASLGTLIFCAELLNNIREFFFDEEETVDDDLVGMLGIFLQETPQVTLNWLLAACREVPVSYYQLVKAIAGMLGSGIRALSALFHYFFPKRKGKKKSCKNWVFRTLLLLGCVYTATGSILVFVFTYSTQTTTPAEHQPPEGFFDKSINSGKYLYKAGVFYSHPYFKNCSRSPASDYMTWLQLDSIYNMMGSDTEQPRVYYKYNTTWAQISYKASVTNYCFRMSFTNCQLTQHATSMCDANVPGPITTLYFQFNYKRANKIMILGDVKYNARVRKNADCSDLKVDENGYFSDGQGQNYGGIRYFKANDETYSTIPFHWNNSTGRYEFYEDKQHIQDVVEAWKTGYAECEMTGAARPNQDNSIQVSCI